MSARSFAAWVFLFSGLTGCAPINEKIYRPEAPGGQLSGAYCGGRFGPKEVVTIARAGVRVEVRASDRSFNERGETVRSTSEQSVATVSFLVAFVIPEGVDFRLLSDKFIVFEQGSNDGSPYPVPDLNFSQRGGRLQRILSTKSFLDQILVRWGLPPPERYWGSFSTRGPLRERFTLAIPRATVNGLTVEFPRVGFTRVTETWVSPMNC